MWILICLLSTIYIYYLFISIYPGSQPPFKQWWFLLEDDKPLLKYVFEKKKPIKKGGQGLPGYIYTSLNWFHMYFGQFVSKISPSSRWSTYQGEVERLLTKALLEMDGDLQGEPWRQCLEDHPMTCKWLGSPPFISHLYRPFVRESALLRGRKLTMVINHVLQVMKMFGIWSPKVSGTVPKMEE